jgi:hypothetical protein
MIDCTETHCEECSEYINCEERYTCQVFDTCANFNCIDTIIPMCQVDCGYCKAIDGALYKEGR